MTLRTNDDSDLALQPGLMLPFMFRPRSMGPSDPCVAGYRPLFSSIGIDGAGCLQGSDVAQGPMWPILSRDASGT